METKNLHGAKFAFYYLFSLVALIFTALSVGMIVFQIINQTITPTLSSGTNDQSVLRFAIASLVFAVPVYYGMQKLIKNGLKSGELAINAGIRRWLTYLIIFIAAVVILVWLIMTLNSFLNGDLTWQFSLKTLTVLIIAGMTFGYYFYDIKKEQIVKGDKINLIFGLVSLILILAAFVSAWFFIDSPTKVRAQKNDEKILSDWSNIDSSINQYYVADKKLPENLSILVDRHYLGQDSLKNSIVNTPYDYKVISANEYELCTKFETDNNISYNYTNYLKDRWPHKSGYQCIKQIISINNTPASVWVK